MARGVIMKLDWMGRHRNSIEAFIKMCNAYTAVSYLPVISTSELELSPNEIQVLEYLLENEEKRDNMSVIAERLQYSKSAFSKLVKQLVSKKLLDRFHEANNSKNVIIRPSEYGRKIYKEYSEAAVLRWKPILDNMDKLSEKDEKAMIEVINAFADLCKEGIESYNQKELEEIDLIKIDE